MKKINKIFNIITLWIIVSFSVAIMWTYVGEHLETINWFKNEQL